MKNQMSNSFKILFIKIVYYILRLAKSTLFKPSRIVMSFHEWVNNERQFKIDFYLFWATIIFSALWLFFGGWFAFYVFVVSLIVNLIVFFWKIFNHRLKKKK